MKTLFAIILVSGIISACNSNSTNDISSDNTAEDSVITEQVQMCFERTEGDAHQDTTTLNLIIEGDNVTGDFNHLPHEKDSRKGTISGKRKGDLIKAVWSFMQEGMNDTLGVEFKLKGDRLLQKNYSINAKTGRQYLSEQSQFVLEYAKVECNK
jgi:hypothetical protein